MHKRDRGVNLGFTIVELLVVIVVIGILAAITIVSYTGISQKAVSASLQSDLNSASNQLKLYQVSNGAFPASLDINNCPVPADTARCLKPSSGNSFTYQTDGTATPQTFSLIATNSSTYYRITSDSVPLQVATVCPYNFIVVPGSSTYGTNNFCVMKYEARQVGATNVPISQASGLPWSSVTQPNAIAYSPNVANCTGCHLITEAEWLTIAQNVLSVPSNWSGGSVGSGYIYSGHNDSVPNNSLAADTNDSNGYVNTGNTSGNQRRTLALSNGEIVWDMAGNLWEWTSGQATGGQPGITGESAFAWKEWNATPMTVGSLTINPFPSFGTSAASGWTGAANGIGRLYSYVGDSTLRGCLRSGRWYDGGYVGIMTLSLYFPPTYADGYFGFRVTR